MSRSTLELKSQANDSHSPSEPPASSEPPRDRRSKVDRTQWPEIVKRREAGETLSQIARDYDVTPAAISNIVKRALAASEEAQAEAPAEEDAAPAPTNGTLTADRLRRRDSAAAPVEVAPDVPVETPSDDTASGTATEIPERHEDAPAAETSEPGAPAGGDVSSGDTRPGSRPAQPVGDDPQARRLMEAATACAALVEQGAAEDAVAGAAHEVRRALAAIEIAQSKRASEGRRGAAASARAASQPANAPAAPAWDTGGSSAAMAEGTVKFFKADKGFGFITPDDGSKDVFVAKKTLDALGIDTLNQGERVRFEVGSGSKGPEAKDIEVING